MDSAVVFLFISVIIIGVALIIIINLTKKPSHTLNKAEYQQRWLAIEQSVGDDNASMQFAVLQADKLLDKALKEKGFQGETMAQRLASSKKNLSNIKAVWAAHKVRNKIAHEDTVTLNRKLTSQILQCIKRALRDLEAL